jgi:hypothetical protein
MGRVTAAIFGLIGVVVGALVTSGVDLLLDKRRDGQLGRQASRLIGDELHTVWIGARFLAAPAPVAAAAVPVAA